MAGVHIALSFEMDGIPLDALEGFFLMRSSLAGVQENDDGSVTFYLPLAEWTSDFERSLRDFCAANAGIEFLGSQKIEDRDWNAEWKATIAPQWATGDLIITPSWRVEEAKRMAARHTITIDPKMSFGTGQHETTRLCLHAIEEKEVKGLTVLDIGTGSGILAIYALLCGAKRTVGIDTDPWFIENATENRALNGIPEERFEIRKGSISESVGEGERFDLVVANLHRNLLIENVRCVRRCCGGHSTIVVSGILMFDTAEVRAAYETEEFVFVREIKENEWSCLIFETIQS